jgi:hypothetical protein
VDVGDRLYLRNAEEAVCYELQSKPADGIRSMDPIEGSGG